jgi:hypothetical protein
MGRKEVGFSRAEGAGHVTLPVVEGMLWDLQCLPPWGQNRYVSPCTHMLIRRIP